MMVLLLRCRYEVQNYFQTNCFNDGPSTINKLSTIHSVPFNKLFVFAFCAIKSLSCYRCFQGRCSGWGLLSIRLVNYKNPSHTLFNGECCDTLTWCSSNQCESYFKFCVTSLGSLQQCNLGSSKTKVLGDDDFQFPGNGGSLGTDLLNPLTYNFSSWQVRKPLTSSITFKSLMIFRDCTAPIYDIRIFLVSVEAACASESKRELTDNSFQLIPAINYTY